MGPVMFYHLTRRPLEATLPVLLERALSRTWSVVIRGTNQKRLEWLDERLWLGSDDGFLPHGLAGGAHDALQPILLSTSNDHVADCLFAVDGAEITVAEAQAAERACILFDGHDQNAVAHARGQWKNLAKSGCSAQYWSEESGSWQMKAEAG